MIRKLALAALLAAPAAASASGFYFVAGAAATATDLGDIEETYGGPVESDDEAGRALIGAGMDVSPYLGLEAAYLTTVENRVESDSLEHGGLQLAVLGKAPLTPEFALFGKLSLNSMLTDYRYDDGITVYEEQKTGLYLGFGVGAELKLNDSFGLRLQYERIQIRDVSIVDNPFLQTTTSADFDVGQVSVAANFFF